MLKEASGCLEDISGCYEEASGCVRLSDPETSRQNATGTKNLLINTTPSQKRIGKTNPIRYETT